MYLGEDHIHREDGVVVKTFAFIWWERTAQVSVIMGMRHYLKDID